VRVSSTQELYREFTEDAYSVALHPSGLWALVGFSDKLRLMNIYIDDIRPAHEFPIRGCREVTHQRYDPCLSSRSVHSHRDELN